MLKGENHLKSLKRQFFMWGQIIAGTMLCSLAYNMFLIPNEIAPGGFTGIAQLLAQGIRLPVGTIALLLNIPLFLFGARTLGLSFGIRSLSATVLLSLSIDLLPVPSVIPPDTSERMLLASVFGGVAGGTGFGLILRGGATTGGSDMLAKLLRKHLPFLSLGGIMFAVDAAVIITSAFVFDIVSAMFALICAFLMSHVIDLLTDGLDSARAYLIISDRHTEIAARIMMELKRGVTSLMGHGLYSGREKTVLLCVVSRTEAMLLRSIVAAADEKAFMVAANVHEALGEGFMPHRPKRTV